MFPSQSSRTCTYLISQGHNSFKPIYKFKDIWIFNHQLISQCLCYTATHFHQQRSWDSFPTDHGGGTSRQLLHAVPSSHRSWDCFFPLARGGGTNRLCQRTTHSAAAESPTECQSKKTTLTTWEQEQCRWNPYRCQDQISWTFCMNIL